MKVQTAKLGAKSGDTMRADPKTPYQILDTASKEKKKVRSDGRPVQACMAPEKMGQSTLIEARQTATLNKPKKASQKKSKANLTTMAADNK